MEILAPAFSQRVQDARRAVDEALDHRTRLPAGCPDRLREAMRYSLLGGGKRLRPLMALMAADACGCQNDSALAAACAVEMVHTYSLIHDDLPSMDDDDLRRGRPTCHKVFGEAMAILAGDALLTLAFEVLSSEVKPPEVAARCCAELAKAAGPAGMVGGQVDDLAAEAGGGALDSLEFIHARKTGAMLRISLRLGALCAGANELQLSSLDKYGTRLGLAFQIMDDLLDVQGEEAALGKRVRKDWRRGKLTFPRLLGVDESRRRAESLAAEACAALASLGSRAESLEALARFVVERKS